MDIIRPAFFILKHYYENPEKNLRLVLSRHLETMDRRSSRGITRTVYGVVRKEQIIRKIIERCSKRVPGMIEPDVLLLLKIGIYLLIFSNSYPGHAVVNEIVDFSGNKAKKFLNANLRTIIREQESIEMMVESLREFPIRYSISDLLIKNLADLSTDLEADLQYLNREPLFHIRVNRKRLDFNEAKKKLGRLIVNFRELEAFDSFEVHSLNEEVKGLLNKQYFYVQNTSSQFVSILASEFCRESVIDCCAAPGTKSVTLSLLRPELKIVANDLKIGRARVMQTFLREYEIGDIHLLVSDARNLGTAEKFDLIIADAPCTSAGTLRKNPDLKLKIDDRSVERNAKTQAEILRSLVPHIKKNGFLLYSVCSFLKGETEDVLEGAAETADFESFDFSSLLSEYGFFYRERKWGVYLLPNRKLNNDLFYLSLLQKKG
jgi:16S rRNA (cytosine967-C5)-methyltransferase